MTRTAPWTTGTATTAARRATVCLRVTTRRLSPTLPCTSIPWGLGSSSSTTQTPAQTLSTVLTWTTGTREEPGRQSIHRHTIHAYTPSLAQSVTLDETLTQSHTRRQNRNYKRRQPMQPMTPLLIKSLTEVGFQAYLHTVCNFSLHKM